MLRFKTWLTKRSVGLIFMAILAIPAIAGMLTTPKPGQENRNLASFPAHPSGVDGLTIYTKQIDMWVNDHFGARKFFVKLNTQIRYYLFGQLPTVQVIEGRNGRIFLAAHTITDKPFEAIMTACGYPSVDRNRVASQIENIFTSFHALGIDIKLMIVPSSPEVYPEDLPGWAEKRCRSVPSPIDEILAEPRLQQYASSIYFPKQKMLELKQSGDVFPKTWFHWAAFAPREIAASSINYFWNFSGGDGHPLVEERRNMPSDLSTMISGVSFSSAIADIDYGKSDVQTCLALKCFDEKTGVFDTGYDISRIINPAAPKKRMVLISDSFGDYISGWYARYFQDVQHLTVRKLDEKDKDEAANLRQYLIEQSKDGEFLLLYYDDNVLNGILQKVLEKIFYE